MEVIHKCKQLRNGRNTNTNLKIKKKKFKKNSLWWESKPHAQGKVRLLGSHTPIA